MLLLYHDDINAAHATIGLRFDVTEVRENKLEQMYNN